MISNQPQGILSKTVRGAGLYFLWTALALTILWLSLRCIQGSPHIWSISGLNSFIFFSNGDPETRYLFIGLLFSGIILTILFQKRLHGLPGVITAVTVSAVMMGSVSAFFVPHLDRITGRYGTPIYRKTSDGCCVEVFDSPSRCREVSWIRQPCPNEPLLLLTVNGIADSLMCHRREPPFPDARTEHPISDLDLLMELHAGGHIISDGIGGGSIARVCLRNSCTLEIFEPRQAVINTVVDVFGDYTGDLMHSPDISIRNTTLDDFVPGTHVDLLYLDLTRYFPHPWTRGPARKYVTANALAAMLTCQEPGPIIAIKCFRFEPPREIPRLLDMAADALKCINKDSLSDRLLVIASADTATIMLSADPFPMKTIASVNWFVRHSPEFEPLFAPGIPFETVLTQRVRELDPLSRNLISSSSNNSIDLPENRERFLENNTANQSLKAAWCNGNSVRKDLNNPRGRLGLWFFAGFIVLTFLFLI